jgi:hypothetical protein
MLFQKCTLSSSVTTGNVFLNSKSTMETNAIADSIRDFLRKLSFIKNKGNKILVTIEGIQYNTKTVFQLFVGIFMPEVKFKCVINIINMIKKVLATEIDIKANK